jgi:hypothetical protein
MTGRFGPWSNDQQALAQVDLVTLVVRRGVQRLDYRLVIEDHSNGSVDRDAGGCNGVAEDWQQRLSPSTASLYVVGSCPAGATVYLPSIEIEQSTSPEKAN